MTIIGIAGPSASGKSTLAGYITDGHNDVAHVSLDDFYLPIDQQPDTFDDPTALDWSVVRSFFGSYVKTGAAHKPVYDFEEGEPVKKELVQEDHLVVEGLWTFYSQIEREHLDLKVYIDTPVDVRFARRVRRDTEERGCTALEAVDYFEQAREKEREHVTFQRDHADFVIEGRPEERQGEILRRLL